MYTVWRGSVGQIIVAMLFATLSPIVAAESPAASTVPKLEPIVVGTPVRLEVFPPKIKLDSPRRQMRLIVTGHYADGSLQDLTRVAQFASANDKVAKVENGVVVPIGNGSTEVIVSAGGQQAKTAVEVARFESPDPVSFHFETLVALSKQGCSSGACHGSPSGKAGFRLSLRAYDPEIDKTTLVREEYGRRTNVLDPDASLMLMKPTMRVAHGGGQKLKKSDPAYAVLRQWIAEGCQLDPADAPQCVKLEVYPPSGRVLKRPAHTQQLLALAHFSDGSVRDVTPLAAFSSSDENVATVDVNGLAAAADRGEAAILVRYLDKIESSLITFVKEIDGFAWPNPPANNYVDTLVYDKLKQLKYAPSDLCGDAEFIRRAYLDVLGALPTIDEAKAFAADTGNDKHGADKRAKLIDTLLDRPEYAKFWALKWADLLRVNDKQLSAEGVHKYHAWLVKSFRDNVPYDRFVQELLTAQGSTFANPAANYYRATVEATDCTETTAQIFLGARLQCAKCHNHPFERWTQDNYYGMAAFFNRVKRKTTGRKDELVIYMTRGGEVTQPRTGRQMKPWLPYTGDAEAAADADRRDLFVGWLAKPGNPFFAKVEANRLWAHVMGRGIVDPIDDFRDSNPPSNAALLDALAKDFEKHAFDRKHVLRTILGSRTYQASAATTPLNKDDVKYFSHATIRMLTAEQLLDAICHVTGVAEKFDGLPVGTRATELPGPDGKNEFLKVFGQPERQTACACERSTDSNLSQALQLVNGPLIHQKLQAADNRFRKLAAAGKKDAEIVTELYWAGLSRAPTDGETADAVKYVVAKPDRVKALEDLCWALLNTNEFLFQH